MSDLTDVLHWLRQSLVVIKEQQAENERLIAERDDALNAACNIRKTFEQLQAENARLREALRQIITHQSLLTELADQTGASIIAREALEGGDDEQT
jgi:predicted nuclease with TOPRIM domain